jgi:hypothetical protein
MRRVVIGCLILASVAGCNQAEKQSLKQFLEATVASLGHRYDDQLKGVSDPERKVRFRVLFARDQLAAADAYLATQPPIGAAARRAVGGYRAAKASELELFERLLAEKRYEPTESEKKQEAELQAEAQRHLETIGRMVDK